MKIAKWVFAASAALTGCSTTAQHQSIDPTPLDTLQLCRAFTESRNESYRLKVANVLVKRGASAEKCQRIISADNALATGIAVVGAATAVGVAAQSGGGGTYSPRPYGAAWDAYRNEYGQLMWRCRDRATGQFLDDYHCAGMALNDYTWPGPY